MIKKLLLKLTGDQNAKTIKKFEPIVVKINALESEMQELSDNDLKNKTQEFKQRLENKETLDDILVEAFAVVREVAKRTLGERHYDVQLLGGLILHKGKIAEMKTGEGKTLVSTLPVYLNALNGKGVHVITVNDYLAKRDALWMGQVYEFLGLTVKYIIHGLTNEERKEAYGADITYGTNNEFGFDYLRDNMATRKEDLVQRKLHYAIIDEVDSILIDEARTPLIISAPNAQSTSKYQRYASLIPQLNTNDDYEVDEKSRSVILTEKGISKMEKLLGMGNIYTEAGFIEVHHIEQALKAHCLFQKDREYVVNDNQVVIVDEFTGRLMPGRRFSEGLHQAIEAKEKVTVRRESKTLSTITFQNYFRLYDKLAGMTGTAFTEAEEFHTIYGLDVVVMPTNKPMVREDRSDVIFKSEAGKFSAIIKRIEEVHKTGQPILVGTISIDKSEELSKLLRRKKIPHQVLNAKQHEKEAEIVSKAGHYGAVTIATNMAGRGTDIKIDNTVKELGGLFILGTERHESRRIDNQLRGRSGRQGDPGISQFFISMEDSISKLFGSDRIKNMMNRLGIPDDMPIENKIVSRAIESAQKRVEGHNFDIRKHVLQYDDVLNKQRIAIYKKRNIILNSEDIHNEIVELIKNESTAIVNGNINPEKNKPDIERISKIVHQTLGQELQLDQNEINPEKIIKYLEKKFISIYNEKQKEADNDEMFHTIERHVYLRSMDNLWMEHIDQMIHLKSEVALQGYGQRDPLQVYQHEAYQLFLNLTSSIQTGTVVTLFHLSYNLSQKIESKVSRDTFTNENEIDGSSASAKSFLTTKSNIPTQHTTHTHTASSSEKVGRNEPCPCGSGKKYKKCCGK